MNTPTPKVSGGGVRDGVEIFKIACYLCCQATATLNHCKIMLILSLLYRMIYSNVCTLIKIRTRLKATGISIRLRKIRLMISPIQLTKLITGKLMNEKCRCQQNREKSLEPRFHHIFFESHLCRCILC